MTEYITGSYYWVQLYKDGKPMPAEFCGDKWYLNGNWYLERNFYCISDMPISETTMYLTENYSPYQHPMI